MSTVAITGHRPEKIPPTFDVFETLMKVYKDLGVTHVIQGMAAGVDLQSARAAYHSGIKFTCAKPWAGHEPRKADRVTYQNALEYADRVVDVDPAESYPGPWVYQKRNEWMVDNADFVIAVWDGTSGGTANCVKYAQKVGKRIYLIDPVTPEIFGWRTNG